MHTLTAGMHTVTAKLHTVTEILTFAARLPARGADRSTGSVGNLGRGSSVGFCGAAALGIPAARPGSSSARSLARVWVGGCGCVWWIDR